jgi:hypothetical protein
MTDKLKLQVVALEHSIKRDYFPIVKSENFISSYTWSKMTREELNQTRVGCVMKAPNKQKFDVLIYENNEDIKPKNIGRVWEVGQARNLLKEYFGNTFEYNLI